MYLKLLLDTLIHCINVCLIHCHAFLRQRGGVIDRNMLKLRMRFPVFIKNQKQLLGSSKSKGRDEDLTTLLINQSMHMLEAVIREGKEPKGEQENRVLQLKNRINYKNKARLKSQRGR
jgi:hypothetical protein